MSFKMAVKSSTISIPKQNKERNDSFIDIDEFDSKIPFKKSHKNLEYDPKIQIGPNHQADISKIKFTQLIRLNTNYNQVWKSSWNKHEGSYNLFSLIFSNGTNTKFDNFFLSKTNKKIKQYFSQKEDSVK